MDNAIRCAVERAIVAGLIAHMRAKGFAPWRVAVDYEVFETLRAPNPAGADAEALAHVFSVDESSLRFVPAALDAEWRETLDLTYEGIEARAVRRKLRPQLVRAEHGVLLIGGDSQDIISDWNYTEGDPDGFSAAMDAFSAGAALRASRARAVSAAHAEALARSILAKVRGEG